MGANPIWNSDFFPSFQLMLFLSFNMKDLGRTKEFAFIVENQTPPPTHPPALVNIYTLSYYQLDDDKVYLVTGVLSSS